VHVDPDNALVRTYLRQLDQRLASAEPDVEHDITDAAEHLIERELRAVDGESPPRHRPLVSHHAFRGKGAATGLERALRRMLDVKGDRHGTMMVTAANVQG
jgi:hypothetical protein